MGDLLFKLARPALFFLDPERAHGVSIRALKFGFARTMPRPADDPILATKVWSLAFPNPVGLAAGFDKHAEVCDAALGLGFGFVEAGTVTPRPQPGNSGQRLYRLTEDEAVINRFGFNSEGLAPFVANLARRRARPGIVGANVGKNRDTTDSAADYIAGIEAVGALADYLVVNISSPNTPGLRALQARAEIEELLARVQEFRRRETAGLRPPLLVKVGPDLDEAEVARDGGRWPHHRQHHGRAARHVEEPRSQRARRVIRQTTVGAVDRMPGRDVSFHRRPDSDHWMRRHRQRRRCLCQNPRRSCPGPALFGAGVPRPRAGRPDQERTCGAVAP